MSATEVTKNATPTRADGLDSSLALVLFGVDSMTGSIGWCQKLGMWSTIRGKCSPRVVLLPQVCGIRLSGCIPNWKLYSPLILRSIQQTILLQSPLQPFWNPRSWFGRGKPGNVARFEDPCFLEVLCCNFLCLHMEVVLLCPKHIQGTETGKVKKKSFRAYGNRWLWRLTKRTAKSQNKRLDHQ